MSDKEQDNRYKKIESDNNNKLAATKHINFGVAIFMMIFAYLVFVMITFAVKEKVNYTIAETGVLTHSNTYNGLIIKKETVVDATTSGEVRYFFTEGARVRNGNTVASIMNDPEMAKILDDEIFKVNQSLEADDPAFDESYEYLQNRIKNYVINQHHHTFENTYAIKREITNDIEKIRNTIITEQTSLGLLTSANVLMLESELENNASSQLANGSGLASYNLDGMENISHDTFKVIDLDRKPEVTETTTKTMAKDGEPLFKIVDNYLWYIAAKIDDECEKQIESSPYITIHFLEKDISIIVRNDRIWNEGNQTFLMLEVDRMLGEFLTDRFVQFEIIFEEHEGIKVPESAVTTMEFALIPDDYLTIINGKYRVHKKVYSEDMPGESTLDGITVNMIKREDGQVYIPISEEISIGDALSFTDSTSLITKEFIIGETVDIEGVYVVNKGFAMFKFVETRYREVDYRIVEPFTPYGVRMYDRIATEGDLTEEYQIIN